MDCPTCEAMVDAYVDGELTAVDSVAFERALEECPECRKRLDSARAMSALLRELPAEPAPDLLRARVERELRTIAGQPRERMRQRAYWSALAASVIVALGLGWLGGTLTGQWLGQDGRESDSLIASYLRAAMAEHTVDVASSDRHAVKPWYAGRLDYAPPVHDLTTVGFPLLGGRLDIVDGRKVAVLVYRRNQHKLALSLWPATASGNSAPRVSERDGFAIAEWRRGGFEFRAVSDVAPAEMTSFAASLDRAVDSER
jgi:anti-sigma factor RsiW